MFGQTGRVHPRLELHHFATVQAIVDAGSLTAAADHLSVSQSAVSHRLAEAERRIGQPLFERRPARGLQPTPAGLRLYQSAARALPDLLRAERDVIRAAGAAAEVVRIGVGSYDCYHWLPGYHRRLVETLPDVLLELVVVGDAPGARLLDGDVDVVLAPGSPSGPVVTRPLFTDELVLLTAPDHALADRGWVEPEALADETYLTYGRTPSPGFEYDRFVRPSGVVPSSVLVIEDTGAIVEMVAAGLGVSILSRWATRPSIEEGKVAAIPCGHRGLELAWNAVLRESTPDHAPEARVATDLATWLAHDT
ncbi:LysR family transcriptional regulator for metE and metH [Ilumatobacter fluminis]|uniref:LysR family transcriptional regulator for metE and metH n=1 Tax=Ilumatobacter fluminis TaxID=467091 RepID=A0A4R7I6Q8_9ACTN|nr:LysR family transcriptional regulator for metE and metH [Ilumatobacter fluminis]